MKQVTLTVPELALNPEQRRAVGWTLLAVGIITTVPLVANVFGKNQATSNPDKK